MRGAPKMCLYAGAQVPLAFVQVAMEDADAAWRLVAILRAAGPAYADAADAAEREAVAWGGPRPAWAALDAPFADILTTPLPY